MHNFQNYQNDLKEMGATFRKKNVCKPEKKNQLIKLSFKARKKKNGRYLNSDSLGCL